MRAANTLGKLEGLRRMISGACFPLPFSLKSIFLTIYIVIIVTLGSCRAIGRSLFIRHRKPLVFEFMTLSFVCTMAFVKIVWWSTALNSDRH